MASTRISAPGPPPRSWAASASTGMAWPPGPGPSTASALAVRAAASMTTRASRRCTSMGTAWSPSTSRAGGARPRSPSPQAGSSPAGEASWRQKPSQLQVAPAPHSSLLSHVRPLFTSPLFE